MKPFIASAFRASMACALLMLWQPAARAAEATGTASATILQPVTVAKLADLDFGKIVAGSSASTVTITPSGQFQCGSGLTCLDSHTIARFNISGVPGMTVNIQADTQVLLTSSGGARMPVALQTSARTMKLGSGDANVLSIGGTLNVAANQAEGVYTGLFTVTVNYN